MSKTKKGAQKQNRAALTARRFFPTGIGFESRGILWWANYPTSGGRIKGDCHLDSIVTRELAFREPANRSTICRPLSAVLPKFLTRNGGDRPSGGLRGGRRW